MKKLITTLILCLFVLTSMKANNNFLNCLNEEESNHNQTVLIFYKPDCSYCASMEDEIKKNEFFQKNLKDIYNIVLVDLSTDYGKNIAIFFNIKSTPTLIKYNKNENNISTQKGFRSINAVESFLNLKHSKDKANRKRRLVGCGDGVVDVSETCDDGNTFSGDGCDDSCQVETGYQCIGEPSNCDVLCGDGMAVGSETCDDGNTLSGDGCDASCQVEFGYECVGEPSNCTITLGINENEINELSVKTFPNPTDKILTIDIHLNENSDIEILLVNTSGKTLLFNKKSNLSQGKNSIALDFKNKISSGTYILKILVSNKTTNYIQTKKIIIN